MSKDKFKLLKRIDTGVKLTGAGCSLLTFADIVPAFQALLP